MNLPTQLYSCQFPQLPSKKNSQIRIQTSGSDQFHLQIKKVTHTQIKKITQQTINNSQIQHVLSVGKFNLKERSKKLQHQSLLRRRPQTITQEHIKKKQKYNKQKYNFFQQEPAKKVYTPQFFNDREATSSKLVKTSKDLSDVSAGQKIIKISKQYNIIQNSQKQIPKQDSLQKSKVKLKKGKKNSKFKQMMRDLLLRTKVQQQIVIKRSQFQSQHSPNYKKNASKQKKLEPIIQQNENENINRPKIPSKINTHRKVSKNNIPPLNRKSQIKLPNIHQFKNIVHMVKQQQLKKKMKKQNTEKHQIDNLPISSKKYLNQNEQQNKIQQKIQAYQSQKTEKQAKINQIVPEQIQQQQLNQFL